MKFKRILAIGAHPDDIEYGCLGFLNAHCSDSEIFLLVLSEGSKNDITSSGKRIDETKSALACLKSKNIFVRAAKGIEHQNYHDIIHKIETIIDENEIDLVLTHGPHDTHQEHVLTYNMTLAACRRRKLSILRYAIVSSDNRFQPDFFFQIDQETVDLKAKMLSYHCSQGDKYYMSREYLECFHSRAYPALHDMRYCESFEIERIMI